MIPIRQYAEAKELADRLRREADQAQGAIDSMLSRLKGECGCKTLEEAQAKLEEIKREYAKAEKSFARALDEFKSKWEEQWNHQNLCGLVLEFIKHERPEIIPPSP